MTNPVEGLLARAVNERASYNAVRSATGGGVAGGGPGPARSGSAVATTPDGVGVQRATALLAANHIHQATIAALRTAIANYRAAGSS